LANPPTERTTNHHLQPQPPSIASTLHQLVSIKMDLKPRNHSISTEAFDITDTSDPLFHVCWRRQSCSSCLAGDVACSWCAIVCTTRFHLYFTVHYHNLAHTHSYPPSLFILSLSYFLQNLTFQTHCLKRQPLAYFTPHSGFQPSIKHPNLIRRYPSLDMLPSQAIAAQRELRTYLIPDTNLVFSLRLACPIPPVSLY